MKPIIQSEQVSKRYRIAAERTPYLTLADQITQRFRFRRRMRAERQRDFWAVKDVSFAVQPGEAVGIIGRNGAGKSTLLKILSQITPPTKGRVVMRGRVASLLEVGTGFHPELTGRENVFLNGAILGMTRADIKARFDEIVAFAEVERFLDTPVKRYSSGMYLRLAFAVAAHLEPEILLVDEVLAVGDAAFQRKCMGKMGEVARQGRTVLFVSHQMPAVKSLCSRAIQIDRGALVRDGEPGVVVSEYLAGGSAELTAQRIWHSPTESPGNAEFRLVAVRALDADGELVATYSSGEPVIVEMEFELASVQTALCVGFDLINRDGVVVFRSNHNDRHEREWPPLRVGRNRLRCVIPPGLLNYGMYSVAPKVGLHAIAWVVNGEAELSFEVTLDHSESPFWNATDPHKFPGVIAPCLRWEDAGKPGAPAASCNAAPYGGEARR